MTVREVSFHSVNINSYVKLNQSFPGVGPEGRDRHGPGTATLVVVGVVVVEVATVDGAQGGVVMGLESRRGEMNMCSSAASVKTDTSKPQPCLSDKLAQMWSIPYVDMFYNNSE